MPDLTIEDVIRNRNLWHTLSTLPPRDAEKSQGKISSCASKADVRKKKLRDEIEWRLEMLRIEQDFHL